MLLCSSRNVVMVFFTKSKVLAIFNEGFTSYSVTKLTFTNRGTQSSDQSAVVLICKLSKLVSYLFIRQYTLKKTRKQRLHGFDLQNIFKY